MKICTSQWEFNAIFSLEIQLVFVMNAVWLRTCYNIESYFFRNQMNIKYQNIKMRTRCVFLLFNKILCINFGRWLNGLNNQH